MKHLIVYAHPNPESLNHFFKETVVKTLEQAGQEIEVRDLYQMNFDPLLSLDDLNGQRGGIVADDVKVEQEFINWADTMTFIHPIWWTGLPAIMKGYIDRILTYGFAYRYDQGVQKGLLNHKPAFIINTHGKSHDEYHAIGMDKALSLTSDTGIYIYCGLDVKTHIFFDRADKATKERVDEQAGQIADTYQAFIKSASV